MLIVKISFVILFCTTVVMGREYRYDYTYIKDADGWFKLHVVPANWHDARLRCDLEGAILASPLDSKLLNAMKSLMLTNQIQSCGVYTGIHATFSRGDYFSIDGVPLNRIPVTWAPNEPDNDENSENCLMMLRNGTMADVKCNDDVFPYICYKEKSRVVMTGCGTHDTEYQLDTKTGSCYKFHRMGQPWSRAYMTCAAEGGYLSIINSDIESQILRGIFAKYPDKDIMAKHKGIAGIGFHDWGVRGSWRTIHGETLQEAGFYKFDNGQPDNATTGEFCGSILRSGLLNDVWCNDNIPFFCEKNPTSLVNDDDKK